MKPLAILLVLGMVLVIPLNAFTQNSIVKDSALQVQKQLESLRLQQESQRVEDSLKRATLFQQLELLQGASVQ